MELSPKLQKVENDDEMVCEGHREAPHESSDVFDNVGNDREVQDARRENSPTNLDSSEENSPSIETTRKVNANATIQADRYSWKLFDRSFDLSKCTKETPLYPICRAWVANQPLNPTINNFGDKRSPETVQRKENGEELLQMLKLGKIKEVNEMPAPRGPVLPTVQIAQKSPTEIKEAKAALDALFLTKKEPGDQSYPNIEDLLSEHMVNWKNARANSVKMLKERKKRYEFSTLILAELFNP